MLQLAHVEVREPDERDDDDNGDPAAPGKAGNARNGRGQGEAATPNGRRARKASILPWRATSARGSERQALVGTRVLRELSVPTEPANRVRASSTAAAVDVRCAARSVAAS
jgi:hypothetical protein